MKKQKSFIKNHIGTVLVFVGIFLIYKYATDTELMDPYLYPSVTKIGDSFKKYWPDMIQNLKASMGLLIPGVTIGVVIALALGIPMGLWGGFRRTIHPVVYSVSMLPVILLSPFAIHMAPTLRAAGLFLIVWGTLWALLFATINGIMTIDKRYLDNADTLEISGFKRLTKIILPAALPSMAAGFVTSMRGAFLSLVFAEMYGTKLGLGYFVKAHSDLGNFNNVWSGFLFMALVMVVVMQIVELVKNRLLYWTID